MAAAKAQLQITEGDPSSILEGVDIATAAEISRLQIGAVTPLGDGQWRITNIRKVGVLRVGDVELRIRPKVSVARLFYLLSRGRRWGTWFDSEVLLADVDDFYVAVAEAFSHWSEQVLRAGLLHSYREVRAAEPFMRGRWLATEQINRRQGLPLPAQLHYDEFTADIAENRIIKAATLRLLGTAGLPNETRARLHRVERQLANVTPLVRGVALPAVSFDRRNERYRPAVALAELILGNKSLEHHGGAATATGYLLNLATVFEDYVEAEVTRHARPFGGKVLAQHRSHLDFGGQVTIKPDLVWRSRGVVRAVFDAKYKVVHSDSYPNADIYQMLAYCIRHGVAEGHLIYAQGDVLPHEVAIQQHGVDSATVRVFAHSVDLSRGPVEIEAQMRSIVERALSSR